MEEHLGRSNGQNKNVAVIFMEGTNLSGTQLEGACLREAWLKNADCAEAQLRNVDLVNAQLEGVDFSEAHLECSCLVGAQLKKAFFTDAHLENSDLFGAQLEGAQLHRTHLKYADLRKAYLKKAFIRGAHLEGADLSLACLEEANLIGACLEEASLDGANLAGANLWGARLDKVSLLGANLEKAKLANTSLKGAHLFGACLKEVDISGAQFEDANMQDVVLVNERRVGPYVADAQWSNVNLSVMGWSQVKMLGDEYEARQKTQYGRRKDVSTCLNEFGKAVRANRQLAVVLESQGLNEDSARFAYRAQVLQRKVLWKQRRFGKWFFSMMLALLAGYGYRMWRTIVAYLLIVLLCAGAYFVLGIFYEPRLSFLDAVLISITAFHGRVFSEPFLRPGDPQLWVTAFEAVAGLVVEGVFIALCSLNDSLGSELWMRFKAISDVVSELNQ